MNICMVTIDSPLHNSKDGITVSVNELSLGLSKKGHKVWILGFDKLVEEETVISQNGVNYICLPSKGTILPQRMIHFMREATQLIEHLDRAEGIDIFHGHGGFVGPIAMAGVRAKKVLTMHTSQVYDQVALQDMKECGLHREYLIKKAIPPPLVLRQYRRWYCGKMDKIISVANHNVQAAIPEMKIAHEKMVVIPNGVNYKKLASIRRENRIKVDENLVLFYGGLSPCKGVQYLLRAIPLFEKRFPDAHVEIIGDGSYRSTLESLANNLRVSDKVKFSGYLFGEELIKKVLSANMVVIPSTYEGCPLTLLESMALGKPLLCSNIPGITEVLENGRDGALFNSADPTDLAGGISSLMSDPDMRRTLGENAETKIREKYDWDRITARYEQVYSNLCG